MSLALLCAGLVGVAAMTWLFPICGYLFGRVSMRPTGERAPQTLTVLIPAHNDLENLKQTLESLAQVGLRTEVRVGLDRCNDGSAEYLQSQKIEFRTYGFQSKWKVLQELVNEAQSTWVAFVDAGTVWPAGLLEKVMAAWSDPGVMGVAPSYGPRDSGWLENQAWRLEASLKSLENRSGGPVTVHGATVFYRRKSVLSAFRLLSQVSEWTNDDVILPFAMRQANPRMRIHYLLSPKLQDRGLRSSGLPLRRRLRMIRGNFEVIDWWSRGDSGQWRARLTVPALLFMRRVARCFWAYYFGFIVLASILYFSLYGLAVSFVLANLIAIGIAKKGGGGSALAAFSASLLSPLVFVSRSFRDQIKW